MREDHTLLREGIEVWSQLPRRTQKAHAVSAGGIKGDEKNMWDAGKAGLSRRQS